MFSPITRSGGLLALFVVAWTALAQGAAPNVASDVYVVPAAGGGDSTDLNTALDSVPAGSTLLVKGTWTNYRVFIRESVTIVGMHLRTGDGYGDSDPDDAILEINAGADANVNLDHLTIDLGASWDTEGTRGINVWSVGNLVLTDSTVRCSYELAADCDVFNRNGDGVVIWSADSVSVVRSSVFGGGGGWLITDCRCTLQYHGPRGGHALMVPGTVGTLFLKESCLEGGAGGELRLDCTDCGGINPTDLMYGGDGGHAVDHPHGVTFLSDSVLIGGEPGAVCVVVCDPNDGHLGSAGLDRTGDASDLGNRLHASSLSSATKHDSPAAAFGRIRSRSSSAQRRSVRRTRSGSGRGCSRRRSPTSAPSRRIASAGSSSRGRSRPIPLCPA